MIKSIFTAAILTVAVVSPMLAGTASAATVDSKATISAKDQLTPAQVARYTDQKGRFHAEWVGQAGR